MPLGEFSKIFNKIQVNQYKTGFSHRKYHIVEDVNYTQCQSEKHDVFPKFAAAFLIDCICYLEVFVQLIEKPSNYSKHVAELDKESKYINIGGHFGKFLKY